MERVANLLSNHVRPAAQPGAVADAAARPEDRCHFEGGNRTNAFPIYQGGAAKRHAGERVIG